MEDSYRHKGMRRKLIQRLQERGIRNEAVLEVMLSLPRHFFLEKAFEEWAYEDKAFPIGKEQTISQPYTVAYQTTLLQVEKGEKILEIGTGSAYQAAVLALLGAKVYTVERQSFLYENATKLIKKLNIPNITICLSDGMLGLKHEAPFDKILVTCGADELPLALVEQLKIGGVLVIPIGDAKVQQMYRITKLSLTEWQEERFDDFRFVPLLGGVV